jgi:hypothetical protein
LGGPGDRDVFSQDDGFAGWPQVVAFPGLPHYRTCPIKAYGSSSHGFTTRRYTEWTTRGLESGNASKIDPSPKARYFPVPHSRSNGPVASHCTLAALAGLDSGHQTSPCRATTSSLPRDSLRTRLPSGHPPPPPHPCGCADRLLP